MSAPTNCPRFRPAFDRSYHERLAARLDNCFRSGKPMSDDDLAAAIAAVMALAASGIPGSEDVDRLNWLERECRNGRVILSINHHPRGVGNCVRAAIDDARRPDRPVERAQVCSEADVLPEGGAQ